MAAAVINRGRMIDLLFDLRIVKSKSKKSDKVKCVEVVHNPIEKFRLYHNMPRKDCHCCPNDIKNSLREYHFEVGILQLEIILFQRGWVQRRERRSWAVCWEIEWRFYHE